MQNSEYQDKLPPRRGLKRFARDTSGSASIESLFWIPIFTFILILIVDTSFIFFGRTQVLRIVQDNNRAFSVGRITSTDDLEDAIIAELLTLTPNAAVTSSVSNGIVTTLAVFPAVDLMAEGTMGAFIDVTMAVSSNQYVEM